MVRGSVLDPEVVSADAGRLARIALDEDGARDITSDVTVPPSLEGMAVIEVRTETILAGRAWADAVVREAGLSPVEWQAGEGDRVAAGAVAGRVHGRLRDILRAERTFLNVLQRACGIAQATRAFVNAVAHTSARILHTRKTAPGLRLLDAASVLAGGGHLHRLDLATTVMVKDNHWKAIIASGGSLTKALAEAKVLGADGLFVEVESLGQVEEACAAGATRLLVDNQSPATVANWGSRARSLSPGIEIEATGGITLENVARYAQAAADFISIGALTHSVKAADVALEVSEAGKGFTLSPL